MSQRKPCDKPKASRKLLTIEQKKEIISAYERGVRIVDLSAMHGIASSSVATILKKKEEIKAASVATGVKTLASKFQRSSAMEEMEKLLIIWINEHQMGDDSLTQEMICSKARMIYKDLTKNVIGSSSAEAEEEFKGSKGWFVKFKRRSGMHSVIRHGEGTSENKEEAEKLARESPFSSFQMGSSSSQPLRVSPSSSNQEAAEPAIQSHTNGTASHAPRGQSSHMDEEAVKMWTKGEITMWLTKYSLENSSLLYLTGEEIIFLHKLKYEAPEFFYHCLESKLHLESLLDLSRATDALADLTW